MRLGEIASSAEYRMDEQFQNLSIFGTKFCFSKLEKNSINLLTIQIVKFRNLLIRQFGKFRKFPKFYNFESYQISIIGKLPKLTKILKFLKMLNF